MAKRTLEQKSQKKSTKYKIYDNVWQNKVRSKEQIRHGRVGCVSTGFCTTDSVKKLLLCMQPVFEGRILSWRLLLCWDQVAVDITDGSGCVRCVQTVHRQLSWSVAWMLVRRWCINRVGHRDELMCQFAACLELSWTHTMLEMRVLTDRSPTKIFVGDIDKCRRHLSASVNSG